MSRTVEIYVEGTREAVEEAIRIAEACGGRGELIAYEYRPIVLEIHNAEFTDLVMKLIYKGGDTK